MTEKEDAVTLQEYLKGHEFSDDSGVKKDEKGRIVLTRAYCHNGHFLLSDEELFDGHLGIKLLGRVEGREDVIYLSPIMNDQRKKTPKYTPGTIVELACPECGDKLDRVAPCGCSVGSFYRTIFLTPAADEDWSIGICDAYGCPRSFIRDAGEIISEVRAKMIESMLRFGTPSGGHF
ncbi:MAG: hypothetical protein Kow0090_07010 [Myxococcota bacterium]